MASSTIPISERPLSERAFVALNRQASIAGRSPVVLLEEDYAALDAATGSRRRSQDALRQLRNDGRVRRVRRGVYLLVAPTGSTEARVLSLVDAVTPKPYLVTAGRALAEFELSDQHFFRIVVLTSHRLSDWSWQGDNISYAVVPTARIWGSGARGPLIAAPERAILDCLAYPRWGVTIAQAAEAIDRAVPTRVGPAGLAKAAKRYGSAAASRRLGYLVELLHGSAAAEPLLPLKGRTNASVLLSSSGPKRGPTNPRWGLRVNVDPDALLSHRIVG